MLGTLFAVRILVAQHSVGTALRTTGSTVYALDLAQARKFLKVTADRHIRDAQRIRNLLDRDRALLLEQLTNLILSLCLNHDESSPFFARISFKQLRTNYIRLARVKNERPHSSNHHFFEKNTPCFSGV